MDTALVWFRRDLRLGDLPTLHTVAESGAGALGLFVLDDRLLTTSGGARRDFLFRSLAALDDRLDGRLLVVKGDPVDVVPRVAKKVAAGEVHVSADYGPTVASGMPPSPSTSIWWPPVRRTRGRPAG